MTPSATLPDHNQNARNWRTEPIPGVLEFHRSLPGYAPTPLLSLPGLARELGVSRLFVKDESSRMGLAAFKILGASYAISRAMSAKLGVDRAALGLERLRTRVGSLGPIELIAATDGNHGQAVAHAARLLGLTARIFTPANITTQAKQAIETEGAQRVELDIPYDDVVEVAAAVTDEGTLLIQDTSWEGYEQIPRWVVDGYSTLLAEADAQLADAGADRLDLVAVPTGVGSLAQAVVSHYRSGPVAPSVLVVEPVSATAVLTSLHAGRRVSIATSPTIMTGLNCGTPTAIGWPVLHAGVDRALAVTDSDATRAVRDLEGLGVDAGPCGAATLAAVRNLAATEDLKPEATVLLLNTESRSANPLPEDSA